MPILMEPYERLHDYRDHSLDLILNQIKNGNIQCGRYASKLKYGVPPDEVKGWWLTNDRHREQEKEEKPEPARSEPDSDSKPRKSKQNTIDLLREIDRRRNHRMHGD